MDRKAFQDYTRLNDTGRKALLDRMDSASAKNTGGKGRDKRRDQRWEFRQNHVAVAVEHPGGGVSRFIVASRNLSAGGVAFIHGGYLNVGSKCLMELVRLDGQECPVTGQVVGCRHIDANIHEVSVRFSAPIDPAWFVPLPAGAAPTPSPEAKRVETPPPADEPIYSAMDGQTAMHEMLEAFIEQAKQSAARLEQAISAEDSNAIRELCQAIKASASRNGFNVLAETASHAALSLDATMSLQQAAADLYGLASMCKRLAVRAQPAAD